MVIYQRRVYPSATFTHSSFLGVRLYVSRHPGVVAYISDTLRVAIPSLVSGVAQEIVLTIIDENANYVQDKEENGACPSSSSSELEGYILRVHVPPTDIAAQKNATTLEAIDHMERGLRNLVLSTLALEHGRPSITSEDDSGISFRLSLRVLEKDRTCAELNEAFATGAWYAPSAAEGSSSSKPQGRVIRPLHQFSESCFGSIQFAMVKQSKPSART